MLWLALVCIGGASVTMLLSRGREADKALATLQKAGWHPADDVRHRARATWHRQQTFAVVGASIGAAVALPVVHLTLSYDGRHGLAFLGFIVGETLGRTAGHVSSGRVPLGRRVAETTPRRLGGYLDRWQLTAVRVWAAVLLIAAPWALLAARAPSSEPLAPTAVVALVLIAAAWLLMVALMMLRALRHRTSAAEEDDLVWQEWLRATVLTNLANSAWLSVCAVGAALWLALNVTAVPPISLELAGWLTAIAIVGLVASWLARTTLPPAVKEALAC